MPMRKTPRRCKYAKPGGREHHQDTQRRLPPGHRRAGAQRSTINNGVAGGTNDSHVPKLPVGSRTT